MVFERNFRNQRIWFILVKDVANADWVSAQTEKQKHLRPADVQKFNRIQRLKFAFSPCLRHTLLAFCFLFNWCLYYQEYLRFRLFSSLKNFSCRPSLSSKRFYYSFSGIFTVPVHDARLKSVFCISGQMAFTLSWYPLVRKPIQLCTYSRLLFEEDHDTFCRNTVRRVAV